MARVAEDGGPSAFPVELGIATGRRSPEHDPHNVIVNAETKVHWFFVEGAFVLHHVHGRDSAQLQKDFDLYLMRPHRDDIALNPSREIADYGIKKADKLQLRHKTLPIPVIVDLCPGDQRKVEVPSGWPVMDVVPIICDQLGIKNSEELSLAFPSSQEQQMKTSGADWLLLSSSLSGQGVKDGDTLLLRKKFFIMNDDVIEAIDGNEALLELIYSQIHHHFVTEAYVGGGVEEDKDLAKVAALLHHIEQGDENLSDEQAASKVMPSGRKNDHSLYEQIVTTYYRDRVSTLQKGEAKLQLLRIFSQPQSIISTCYLVTVGEDTEEKILAIDSNTIRVCDEVKGTLQTQEIRCWRLRDLQGTDTEHKDQCVELNILGTWHQLYTKETAQVSSYIMEAHKLMKTKVARARISHIPSPTGPTSVQPFDTTLEPPRMLTPEVVVLYRDKRDEAESTGDESKEYEWPANETQDEKTVAAVVTSAEIEAEQSEHANLEASSPKAESEEKEEFVVEEQGSGKGEGEGEEDESKIEEGDKVEGEGEDLSINDIDEILDQEETKPPSKPLSGSSTPTSGRRPINILLATPGVTGPPANTPATPERKSPAKSASGSSTYTLVHIPEYLGQDYRKVLEDYRLFHIIVLKQDIRTLLIDVRKPVREVTDAVCATFGICNPNLYHLWIPTGIQLIIEKYGGKPKTRTGKFVRRPPSSKDFSARLDANKALADQYDFNIRPFLLHLRKYQADEDVDMPDESLEECGQEWPDFEHPDVARYRMFYQSWMGAVQGVYPVDRESSVKLAALLSHIYYGDRAAARIWPPTDYDAKMFLPEKLKHAFGIVSEVEKAHKDLIGKSVQQCISECISVCKKTPTYQGVFFDVAVPVKADIMAVIPWNKMQHRTFGINSHGVFSISKDTGKILFVHRFSDIYNWSSADNSFHLNFKEWAENYHAYTYQTREILDVLELFIQMTVRGKINQAPARPPSLLTESPKKEKRDLVQDLSPKTEGPTPHDLSPKTEGPATHDLSPETKGPKPHDLSPEMEGPRVQSPTPKNNTLELSPKRSSTSSPTTYDALDV